MDGNLRQPQASSTWAQLYLTRVPSFRYSPGRTAQTTAALTRLKPVWNNRGISFSSKIQVMLSLLTSVFLYACESWALTYKHITSEEISAMIQQAIGPHEDLLTVVKRRKLKWYGHVSRSSGLANIILQGTVKGVGGWGWGRRQGRQKKTWKGNIRKCTGLEFAESQRAVENRETWRKLVVKSSAVPLQPPKLWYK